MPTTLPLEWLGGASWLKLAFERPEKIDGSPTACCLAHPKRAGMITRPNTLDDVARLATVDTTRFQSALAGFLDSFYMRPDDRQAMIDPEPRLTGACVTDAYMGAVGEHLARRWGLAIPSWTESPSRRLKEPVFATSIEALKALLLAQSPLAFRRRMLFVEHEPLRRARMPKAAVPGSEPSVKA